MPRMRAVGLAVALALSIAVACSRRPLPGAPDAAVRAAIADTLTRLMADAYTLSRPDVVKRAMALYPVTGPVVSAAAGRVTTSREDLEREIRQFWDNVGRNMRGPAWRWGTVYAEVITRDAAVLTATYSIPHTTPAGRAHTVGGAWTALFERRDGRWVIVQEHLSDAPEQVGTLASPEAH